MPVGEEAPARAARSCPELQAGRPTVKVRVDPDICQGHTLCAMAAPDLFALSDEDGHATAVSGEVPVEQEEAALTAARSCPEQAVVLSVPTRTA